MLAGHAAFRVVDQPHDVAIGIEERDQPPGRDVEGRLVEGEAIGLQLLVSLVHAVHEKPAAGAAASRPRLARGQDQVGVLVELEVRRPIGRGLDAEESRVPLARGLLIAHELDDGFDSPDAHGCPRGYPSISRLIMSGRGRLDRQPCGCLLYPSWTRTRSSRRWLIQAVGSSWTGCTATTARPWASCARTWT